MRQPNTQRPPLQCRRSAFTFFRRRPLADIVGHIHPQTKLKKGLSGGLGEEERRELQKGLISLAPALNEPEVKKIFKAVELAWASSFFQAFMSTTVIFGGIGLAVFFAFGVSTDTGIDWAIKELSDNVADVCSVITIAYLAYTFTMILYGLSLGRQIIAYGPFLNPLKVGKIFQKASNMPNFSI